MSSREDPGCGSQDIWYKADAICVKGNPTDHHAPVAGRVQADYITMEGSRSQGFQTFKNNTESKVHGANMGPIWGRQDPGGPHERCYLENELLNKVLVGKKVMESTASLVWI